MSTKFDREGVKRRRERSRKGREYDREFYADINRWRGTPSTTNSEMAISQEEYGERFDHIFRKGRN